LPTMLFKEVVQLVLAAIVLWSRSTEAAPLASVKLCGRQLSEIMSRVCHAYNSPSWDVPTGKYSSCFPVSPVIASGHRVEETAATQSAVQTTDIPSFSILGFVNHSTVEFDT
ncbi:Insulin-like peptide 2, partial [Operophtera brumata]